MEIIDGLSLTCHIRTVEVCRELTAAIAALATSETTYQLPAAVAAGALSPLRAPVDYRLGHHSWGVVAVDLWRAYELQEALMASIGFKAVRALRRRLDPS